MAKKAKKEKDAKETENEVINENQNITEQISEENQEITEDISEPAETEKKEQKDDFEIKYNELNDKYLRLVAEYDNYRKRTLKERMELMKNAGEDILVNFLPILDNIERARRSVDEAKEIEAVKEGINLIHKNIFDFLSQKGIKEIDAKGEVFDTDLHEAITKIPAQDETMKGKVIDVIEKGYKMKDKILRYSKVVVGE
jgi:molecular chaperone GrpE